MELSYTPAQRRAIEDRDGAVLVSAAAGSGKTRVLAERLAARVTDREDPVDVDRFLVITFSRAAAAELRDRILKTLNERVAAAPEDRRLQRQPGLCCRAYIGTIHSFCADLVRENCHALGLPPRFTVMEDDRAETLRAEVASRLLDARYETLGDDPAFRQLVDTVGAGADDARLLKALLELHEKLRSQPFPEDWAAKQRAAFSAEGAEDAAATDWGKTLLRDAEGRLDHWCAALEAAVGEMADAPAPIAKNYGERFAAVAEQLREARRCLPLGWDRAREAIAAVAFPSLTALRKYPDEALKARMSQLWAACKSSVATLKDRFAERSEILLGDLRALAPAMGRLLDLCLELDRAFRAAKEQRGCLDYADLEHRAVELLLDPATGERTALARETAERFVEVMVDEYQDVSPIQERIFRAVSRDERNLFLVGDVKQSIYRFRLADPHLFLKRYETYARAEAAQPGEPRRIDLQSNFRSRSAVLRAVNGCFSALMSPALGELEYDDAAALHYGATCYSAEDDETPELCVLGSGDEDDGPEASELEARFIARRILDMVARRVPVADGGGARPCRWSDFALLLRSPGGKGRVFHRVLAGEGIPVASRQGDGFFTSLEITVAIDLLSLVDNPHADVPLISALRSPVFGFSGDELALIRAGRTDRSFYSAVCAAAEEGDAHCASFLRTLNAWRAAAAELSLDRLLWRICGDTDLFAVCAAMPDGEGRRRNLMRLFEYAADFTSQGYRGVFRFVRWLRALAENGAEPELRGEDDAVRILSIHKSKGLEFPFVFLCDLSHQFNRQDLRERVLIHPALGLGPMAADPDTGVEYPTLARLAVSDAIAREALSEELRLLYVAMTRARERLIMTMTLNDREETLEKLRAESAFPLPPERLRTALYPGRWLLQAALLPDSGVALRLPDNEPERAAEAPAAPEETVGADAETRLLASRLDWRYPWPDAARLPARLTATELNRLGEADAEETECLLPAGPESLAPRFRRPAFGEARPDAAARGTAAHAFLQHLDPAKTGSLDELRSELERLTAEGRLRPEEAETVDLDGVLALFRSPLGRAMLRAGELRREQRFTLLAEASEYFPGAAPDDRVLLQGVVDCCFVEDGGVTVVDYKTDRVTADELPERAERYRPQLAVYARALERLLGLPVRRQVLWFLHARAAVELQESDGN